MTSFAGTYDFNDTALHIDHLYPPKPEPVMTSATNSLGLDQLNASIMESSSIDYMTLSAIFSQAVHPLEISSLRPIPPPQSREVVRGSFDQLAGWTSLDSTGEVLFATHAKKRKSASDFAGTLSTSSTLAARNESSTPDPTRAASQPPAAKKRRLILASNAEVVAGHIKPEDVKVTPLDTHQTAVTSPIASFTDNFSMPDANLDGIKRGSDTMIKTNTVFEEGSEDEGYYTGQVGSPNSTLSAQSGDGQDLINQLAQIQQQISPQFVPSAADYPTSSTKDAAKEKERRDVEERSAKRSKELRERLRAGDSPTKISQSFLDDRSSPEPQVEPISRSLRDTLDSISNQSIPHFLPSHQRRPSSDSSDGYDDPSTRGVGSQWHGIASQPFPWSRPTQTRPRRIERSSPDYERLLDIAQSVNVRKSIKRTQPRNLGGLHPSSRLAAERWRTQSRHNEHNTRWDSLNDTAPNDAAREDRLRRVQNGMSKIVSQPDITRDESHLDEFVDHEIPSPSHERKSQRGMSKTIPQPDTTQDEPNLEELVNNFVPGPEPERLEKPVNHQPSAISGLLQQQRKKDEEVAAVPLGERADIDVADFEAYKAERKRLRDLRYELTLIQETYIEMARIYAHRDFEPGPEETYYTDARMFVLHVVKRQLSGNLLKGSMVRARDGFRRRVQSKTLYALTSEEDVDDRFQELLTKPLIDKIEDGLQKLDQTLRDLEAERQLAKEEEKKLKDKLRSQRRTEKQRQERESQKQVRFATDKRPKPAKAPKLNKTDRELLRLRGLASAYEEDRSARETQDVAQQQEDTESVTSEEDADGENFIQGGYQSATSTGMMAPASYNSNDDLLVIEHQDMDEVNAIEDSRQADQARTSVGQAFDKKLILENQLAAINRQEAKNVQQREAQFDDLEAEPSDTEASESEHDDTEVFQYGVTGEFYGVEDREDGSEYTFNQYYDRTRAEDHIRTRISQLQRKYALQYALFSEMKTSFGPEGMESQQLTLGEDFSAKLWIKKRLVPLAKANARKARRMARLGPRINWYVDWQKTVETTMIKSAGASINETAAEDDEDDLFGTSTPEPDIVEVSTRTEGTELAGLEVFSNALHANMAAKEFYMAWFEEFVPAHERRSIAYPHYDGQLELVHEALKSEVDGALEGVGVGPWEEEFERPPVISDDRLCETKVKERMRVVVRQMKVKGPPN